MLDLLGDGWERVVAPGERWTFGRGGPGVDQGLADDERLHRHCGTIVVDEHGWALHNTGRWLRLRVVSSDRFGVDSLLPGQVLRVPWPEVRVQVFAGQRGYEFEARYRGRRVAGDGGEAVAGVDPSIDDATVVPVRVDRSSGYFRALVALCEPRLVDPSSGDVATDLQIARRLNRSGAETGRLTGKTVERRLDNCRTRFGLKVTDELGLSSGLERRDARRLLVDVALLTATVTAADLDLLGPAEPVDAPPERDRSGSR